MRSINALSSHHRTQKQPPKPPTSSNTRNNPHSKPPHKPLTQVESYSFRPSSSSGAFSLNQTNALCKHQRNKVANRVNIPIKHFDSSISHCDCHDCQDEDNSNSNNNNSCHTHKPLSFRRINSYSSHGYSNSQRCNYKQRQCKGNCVNKSYKL